MEKEMKITKQEQIVLLKEMEKDKANKYIARTSLAKSAEDNIQFFKKHLNNNSNVIKTIKNKLNEFATTNKEEVIVKNYNKAKEEILKIDLRNILDLNIELKVCYKDTLFNLENTTYIAKFKNGEYRLFVNTRGYKKDGEWINFHPSLTLINLYILIYNVSYKTALEQLMKVFNIKINGRMQKLEQAEKMKFADNTLAIRKEIPKYNNLMNFIGGYLYILEHLNYISLETTIDEYKQFKNNNIFFATVRDIAGNMKELEKILDINIKAKSKSSISKALSLFRAFGLIKEVEFEIAKDHFDTRKGSVEHYQKKFYITVILDEKVLKKADKIAKKLLDNDITIKNFEYEEVKDIDEDLATKVFINTIKTNINKANAEKFKKATEENIAEDTISESELAQLEGLFN